jgi:hypothetical protein
MASDLPNLSLLRANPAYQDPSYQDPAYQETLRLLRANPAYQDPAYQKTLKALRSTLASWAGPIDEAHAELYRQYEGAEIVTPEERKQWQDDFKIFKKMKEALKALYDNLELHFRPDNVAKVLAHFGNQNRSLRHYGNLLFLLENDSGLPPNAFLKVLDQIIT